MPKQNFNEKLTALLKTHPNFLDDTGELIPAAVRDHAWRLDHNLIKLLLTDPEIKTIFFDEIDGHWVFNYNTFIGYITDKNFLANSYTRFRNKIGLNIDGKFLRERGEVSLMWPYKDCVLEGGQTKEEEKRKEIFFNEILAQDEINRMFDPKVLTNWKRHTAESGQENGGRVNCDKYIENEIGELKRDENGIIRENLIYEDRILSAGFILSGGPLVGYDLDRLLTQLLRIVLVNGIESAVSVFDKGTKDTKGSVKIISLLEGIKSHTYQNPEDKIIDLAIALESLYLLDRDGKSELAFQLRLRASWFLGKDKVHRKELMKDFSQIYEWRSKVVHTGKLPNKTKKIPFTRQETKAFIEKAQDLCRQSIIKILEEGKFPDWNDLILG